MSCQRCEAGWAIEDTDEYFFLDGAQYGLWLLGRWMRANTTKHLHYLVLSAPAAV